MFSNEEQVDRKFFYYITSLPKYLGPVKYVLNLSVKIFSGERTTGSEYITTASESPESIYFTWLAAYQPSYRNSAFLYLQTTCSLKLSLLSVARIT